MAAPERDAVRTVARSRRTPRASRTCTSAARRRSVAAHRPTAAPAPGGPAIAAELACGEVVGPAAAATACGASWSRASAPTSATSASTPATSAARAQPPARRAARSPSATRSSSARTTSSRRPREGRELIAHELTHTIQQGAAVQRSAEDVDRHPVDAAPHVQRLGISDALDYIADKANNIPGFRMFTHRARRQPDQHGARSSAAPANILRALIEFIPGGGLITQALDNYGIFDKVGTWVDAADRDAGHDRQRHHATRSMTFLNSLGWSDIFRPRRRLGARQAHLHRADRPRSSPSPRGSSNGILEFIKDAILRAAREAGRRHARLRPAEGGARQGSDHRRPGPAHRRDADRRLHEADRPGGDLGEHEEGQRGRRAPGPGSRARWRS